MSLQLTVIDNNQKYQVDGFPMLENYEVRVKLLAQVVRCELMNLRAGNAHTKTRGEVRGGGRKPWRQKVQVELDTDQLDLRSGKVVA